MSCIYTKFAGFAVRGLRKTESIVHFTSRLELVGMAIDVPASTQNEFYLASNTATRMQLILLQHTLHTHNKRTKIEKNIVLEHTNRKRPICPSTHTTHTAHTHTHNTLFPGVFSGVFSSFIRD